MQIRAGHPMGIQHLLKVAGQLFNFTARQWGGAITLRDDYRTQWAQFSQVRAPLRMGR